MSIEGIVQGNPNDNVKVLASFEQNGKVYDDVNLTARNPEFKNDTQIPNPDGQKGLTNVNNMMNKAHAEIGSMNQSYLDGNRGGSAVLTVAGEPICDYCKKDVKKMGQILDLDSLTVKELETGMTYNFYKNNNGKNDFLNIPDGGKRWE